MSCIMCLKLDVERGNVKAYIPAQQRYALGVYN